MTAIDGGVIWQNHEALLNALYQGGIMTAGQVGSAYAALKEGVAGKKNFFTGEVKA